MEFWKIPAVVLAFLTWWSASPTSLADASRREALRRQAAPRAARSLTNQDLPVAPPAPADMPPPTVSADEPPDSGAPPVAVAAGDAKDVKDVKDKDDKDAKHDEAWWRGQMSTALATLDHDQEMALAMQSRINALTTDWTNRDDPAQRAQLFQQRQKALVELDRLRKDIAADGLAIDALKELARRQGVPAGWIREPSL